MRDDRRGGFKVVDLMVAILVIGLLLGILVPAMKAARESGRRVSCSNNLRQISLSLLNFSTSKNRFPNAGTFHDDPSVHQGDPSKSNIYLSITTPARLPDGGACWLYGWVMDILPYLDQWGEDSPLFDWEKTLPYWSPVAKAPGAFPNATIASMEMGVLKCPDDPTTQSGRGNLSYVVNGGFVRWPAIPVGWSGRAKDGTSGNGEVLRWVPPGSSWEDAQAVGKKLGVMFLGTDTGDQPWDIATTTADISDGSAFTLMVGENTLAGHSTGNRFSNGRPTNWACPLPSFAMFIASDDVCRSDRSPTDCLGGQLGLKGKGWARANQSGTFENLGFGQSLTEEGSFPFVSSGHPGGSNFAFCDGAVRFLSDAIDGNVYAGLVTPAGGRLPGAIQQGPLRADVLAQ